MQLVGAGSIAASDVLDLEGTFDISGVTGDTATIQSLNGTAGNVQTGSKTLVLTDANDHEFAGVIAGTGGLTVAAGKQILSGVNTYNGTTGIVSGATLQLKDGGSVAASSRVIADGVFDVSAVTGAEATIQSLGGAAGGRVLAGDKTLVLSNAADNFAGGIEGTGGVRVAAGTQTFSGTNAYSGETGIAAGATLGLAGAGSIATSSRLNADGTFDITAVTDDEVTLQRLNGAGSGRILTGNRTLVIANADASDEFAGVIDGEDGDVNIDAGTQVLSGANTYSGTTSISNGAVLKLKGGGSVAPSRVEADGTFDVSAILGNEATIRSLGGNGNGQVLLDGKTLVIADADDEFAGAIKGSGGLTIAGGTQALSGANEYSGNTLITADGELQLGNDQGASGSIVSNVLNEGLFSGSGSLGNLTNKGTVSSGTDTSFGTLKVNGDYASDGGRLVLHEELGGDNSKGDRLVVTGNTSGSTEVTVVNRGGLGGQTTTGIKVIEVGGQSDGAFSLKGDYADTKGEQVVVGGAYAYTLEKGDGSSGGGDWYLRNELKDEPKPDPEPTPNPDPTPAPTRYSAGAPVYEAYSQALLGMNGLPTLRARGGNRYWNNAGNRVVSQGADAIQSPYAAPDEAGSHIDGNGVWGRIEGAHNRVDSRYSTAGADYNSNMFRLEAGLDAMAHETATGALIAGASVHYIRGRTKVSSLHDTANGGGSITTDGYGLGGSLTWYGENGLYVDGQAQASWYRSDLDYDGSRGTLVDGNKGFGYAFSVEGGQRIALNQEWSLTPQAQLTYSSVDFDSFQDSFGAAVGLDRGRSLQGRLGLAVENQRSWQNARGLMDRAYIYGIGNLYYEFLEGTRVNVADTVLTARNGDDLWGGIGIGGSYNWDNDKYSLYGEGSLNTGLERFGDNYSYKGSAGLRVKW